MEDLLHGLHLDLDDDFYVYQVDTEKPMTSYELYEGYKIHDGGDTIIRRIGSWSGGDPSLDFMKEEDKNSRRRDLRVSIYKLLQR